MFKNHLKIAFRNILKNKVFSLINTIGLSIGLSAAFVIGAIIYHDLSFDTFHKDSDRIYRITTDFTAPEGDFYNRGVAVPLGHYAKEYMTGLETVSTFFTENIQSVQNENGDITFQNIQDAIITDANYFDLFSYTWLAGSSASLQNPAQLVLTTDRASRYFPNKEPKDIIGQVLLYNGQIPMTVAGIVQPPAQRTDLFFKEFLSLQTVRNTPLESDFFNEEWNSTNSSTMVFVKLASGTELTSITEQLDAVAFEHADKQTYEQGQRRNFKLQPLSDLHFNGTYGIFNNSDYIASKTFLVGLGLVALFLLLLGCINFINLNTAQALQRAKEIGIRKTLGSSKKQLIGQFMGETFLLTIGAAALSILMASWLFQIFTDFIPKGAAFSLLAHPMLLTFIAVVLILVTLLSGSYPAFILSNYKPVSVLKGGTGNGSGKSALRKYLTIFQFVVAQVFIVATLLVGKQLNFLASQDMGFKTQANALVRAWHNDDLDKRIAFASALKKIPEIELVSLANNAPASNNSNSVMATFRNGETELHTDLQQLFGDKNYLELYKIELLAGRDRLNDTISEYIINETYAEILGFQNPAEAIGQVLEIDDEKIPVVGVMKDFHQGSLRTKIKPMALIGDLNREFYAQFNTLHFSLDDRALDNLPYVIDKVNAAWTTIYGEDDFEVQFMEDTVRQFYQQERQTGVLLKWATGLAILISCLGLLGLVVYSTQRRVREIGIRKVLGASFAQLNLLLCKEFLMVIGIAFLIAMPIAWWGMYNWLQGFAFKTEMSWWVLVGSGLAMLVIALLIVSIRTVAAARENPVKSLRTE
jgi:ABC-type antimicrobial peptide transport system permease subunit